MEPDREVTVAGRPPARLWRALRPFVLAFAAMLATLGIPILLRDPARLGHRTAEIMPREDDPDGPS